MEYKQIGFSNIRLPDNRNSGIYEYSIFNKFPQEVFLHEFLHTLERNEQENGNQIAKLHDNEKYGYTESATEGLKEWYEDYMQNTIENAPNMGLTDFAYASKPIHESNFEYASKPIHESNFEYGIELDYLDEPDNIIEEIRSIIDRIGKVFFKSS